MCSFVHCLSTGWFEIDKEHNHNVYVSGLPLDVTKEEFVELMSKCGIIMENEDGTKPCPQAHSLHITLKGEEEEYLHGDEANKSLERVVAIISSFNLL